jgi:hypothetical protein
MLRALRMPSGCLPDEAHDFQAQSAGLWLLQARLKLLNEGSLVPIY